MIFKRNKLYSGKSSYGTYTIIDGLYNGRPARVLYGDDDTPQSGAARDEHPELLFSYNQRFLEIIMSHQPKRLLVIGGGVGMLPIAAFHRFSAMLIDVVEIDELLVRLSREFFDLPDDERLAVHVGDGAEFVAQSADQYDMIIIDAFSGFTIPPHLLQHETLLSYKQHLTKDGIVAVNFISEYRPGRPKLAHELLASFGEVFSNVVLYQADSDYMPGPEQNLLLVAANQPVHFEYLQSEALDNYLVGM